MSFDEYITSSYGKYLEYSRNMSYNSKEDYRDVCNECISYVYEWPKEKREKIYIGGYLDWYIIRMIYLSYTSERSTYNTTYNRIKYCEIDDIIDIEDEVFDDSDDIRMKYINFILMEKCTYYQQQVFLQYHFKHGSFRKFMKATNIPESSLWKEYKKVIKIIKDNFYLLKNNN